MALWAHAICGAGFVSAGATRKKNDRHQSIAVAAAGGTAVKENNEYLRSSCRRDAAIPPAPNLER